MSCFQYGYTWMVDICQTNYSIHSKLQTIFSLLWDHNSKYKIEANERLKKILKKLSTIQFDLWVSLFISVINRSGTCYFTHAPNQWHLCWCAHVLLHASNGEEWLWTRIQNLSQDMFPRINNSGHKSWGIPVKKFTFCILLLILL